jgi:aarF domain-containing kinase
MNKDTHFLPAEIDKIFRRVQDSAHYMPDWQMEVCLPFFYTPTSAQKSLASHDHCPRAFLGKQFHKF